MANQCPKCGQDNRPGSRFCAVCGGPIAGPANAGAGVQASAAIPPAAVGPVVAKASAAIAPVAKQAAAKGWAGSKRGVGFLARVFTIGGRAAYSEVFGSLPTASGQVAAPPNEAAVAEPIEPAALVFVLALLGGWLAFTLPPRGTAIVIIAAPLVLLVLSWLGFRRPYFTKMTFTGLAGRMRNRGRARPVPIYKFQVYEQTTGQPLDVVMVGPRQGSALAPGANVHLWGIRHPGRNELRTWRVEAVDSTGKPLGLLTAPRLIPLTVALFLPSILLLLVWLITLFV
jgi:hypothetical protein